MKHNTQIIIMIIVVSQCNFGNCLLESMYMIIPITLYIKFLIIHMINVKMCLIVCDKYFNVVELGFKSIGKFLDLLSNDLICISHLTLYPPVPHIFGFSFFY